MIERNKSGEFFNIHNVTYRTWIDGGSVSAGKMRREWIDAKMRSMI